MKKQIRVAKKRVVLVVLTAVLPFAVSSCTDDFVALNTPPHQISEGNIDVGLLGQTFAQSQYRGMFGSAGNFQLGQSLFGDLYSQYFATTAENFDSDQFVEVGRWINGAWRSFYGNGARALSFVESFSAENEGLELQNAVVKIWKVQLYHRMTDYWGPILYSQVGNGDATVAYDSQQDVYMNFFDTLDEAVGVLNQNRGGSVFAGHDQVFDGSVDGWITFANSLRLRLAMRIRYADPGKAKAEAEKAVAAGVMTDNSHNAMLKTTANSRHPYNVITNWGEFRMSSAMESILEGYDDPRIGVYFSPSANGDSDGDGSPYEGMRNGLPRIQKGAVLNPQYSDMGTDAQTHSFASWAPRKCTCFAPKGRFRAGTWVDRRKRFMKKGFECLLRKAAWAPTRRRWMRTSQAQVFRLPRKMNGHRLRLATYRWLSIAAALRNGSSNRSLPRSGWLFTPTDGKRMRNIAGPDILSCIPSSSR